LPTRDAPPITIRHLLTHAAGFPEDNPWGDRQLAVPDATMDAWLRLGLPFSNPPGVAFEYSNYGFALLGRVVARASGLRYRDYVDRHVLRPLGMASTAWEEASVPADRLARGYRHEGGRWTLEPALADGSFGAMGGLYSSVPDLARYVALFLDAWPPRDDPETGPVRRASLREMQQPQIPSGAPSASRAEVPGSLTLNVTGYGYGLGSAASCRFRRVVGHSGGLPGYGSQMRWLPDHRVGIVALANRTYAPLGSAVTEAFAALEKTGALVARPPAPSPALLAARAAVDRLVGGWDDAVADAIAADNLFLDRSRDQRRRELDELRTRHGACRADGELEPENALRGAWRLACDRGALRVTLTLAPTQPPKVQHLEVVSALPLGTGLGALVDRLAARVGERAPEAGDLVAPGLDPLSVARTLGAAAAWGRCRVGEVRSGGGDREATVRLRCDQGELDAQVTTADGGERLAALRLVPAPGQACVP
jgi:CubicO group peptidase (beta-lactamase class C family)